MVEDEEDVVCSAPDKSLVSLLVFELVDVSPELLFFELLSAKKAKPPAAPFADDVFADDDVEVVDDGEFLPLLFTFVGTAFVVEQVDRGGDDITLFK